LNKAVISLKDIFVDATKIEADATFMRMKDDYMQNG